MPVPKFANVKHFRSTARDRAHIAQLVSEKIELYSPDGIGRLELVDEVAREVVLDLDDLEYFLMADELDGPVKEALAALEASDLIGYHHRQNVWYFKGSRALSSKEAAYFRAKGFSPGWRRISKPMRAIAWIHKTLSPMQFETFCMSLLSEHCNAPTRLTEKDLVTGADGGFDGVGEIELGDERGCKRFGVQVKRYALHRQVGYLDCERFGGKSYRHGLDIGFIITTGLFNEKATLCVADYLAQGLDIELIDQNRLITIMAKRNDNPHGYGLHTSRFTGRDGNEVELHYINENDILRAAGA